MNFATGLTLSVFFFVLRLPSLIWSYAPAAVRALIRRRPAHACKQGPAAQRALPAALRPTHCASCSPLPRNRAPQWSAVLFFCVATVAAVSVVAAYLGLLFGAGAAATYSTLWMVANADRQRLGYEGQERRRLEGAAREHHE